MKTLIKLFSIAIVLSLTFAYVSSNLGEKLNNEINKTKNMLGKTIVFRKDTLQVVDYSIFDSTVTLENGTILKYDFAKTLDTIPNVNK